MGNAAVVMKQASRTLGMTHKEFCQGDVVKYFDERHAQGACFGFSTVYLAFQQGKMEKDFFASLTDKDFTEPGLVNYVTLAQNWQLKKELSEEGQLTQEKLIMEMFGYSFVDSQTFSQMNPDYVAFTEYAGKRDRVSMVDIPGHQMAAVGKTFGMKFFDPNSGEVSCNTTATMAKFLNVYFHNDKIKNFYLRNNTWNAHSTGPRASLFVKLYKKRGS